VFTSDIRISLNARAQMKTLRYADTRRIADYAFTGAVYAEHVIEFGADWNVVLMTRPEVSYNTRTNRFGLDEISTVEVQAASLASRGQNALRIALGILTIPAGFDVDEPNVLSIAQLLSEVTNTNPLIGMSFSYLSEMMKMDQFVEQYGDLLKDTQLSLFFSYRQAAETPFGKEPLATRGDGFGERQYIFTELQHRNDHPTAVKESQQ
jgi:hypothetical protein